MKNSPKQKKVTVESSWVSVQIVCESGFEDIISTYIFESGFSGIKEHEESGSVILTAFFPESPARPSPLDKLENALNYLKVKINKQPGRILSVNPVPQEDWETSWREGLEALEIGSSLVVRPSWADYENEDNRIEIIIDPKMAFGTGNHATTYLCLELLESIDLNGLSVLDSGCGSGILSIAAVKFGARCVYGFDNDVFSVENALENVIINRVNDRVTINQEELNKVKKEPCDLVLANMISSILVPNLRIFRKFLKNEGTVIFSGLLAEEETFFAQHLEKNNFRIINITGKDEWIAVRAGV